MNARQALKAATKHIEELEHYNARCKADITAYNRIITGMISGEIDPCDWCEEREECQLAAKNNGGCTEWWLAYNQPSVKEESDDSEAVPITGSDGRA